MRHVFISYVHENVREVNKLYKALIANGVRVWIDRNDIEPGRLWEDAIRKAISEGDYFIACFSKEYNVREKTYMNEELNLAVDELRKRPKDHTWFIPIVLSGEIPDWGIGANKSLRDLQYVELSGRKWNIGLQQILGVLKPRKNFPIPLDAFVQIPLFDYMPNRKIRKIASFSERFGETETLTLSADLLPRDTSEMIAFSVKGNAMSESLVNDGDVIIFRPQPTAKNGEMVAVWLKRARKTVLRRIYKEKTRVRLQPMDPRYGPSFEKVSDIEVDAKLILVIRQLVPV